MTVRLNDGGYPIESEVVRMCVLPKSYRKETPFASCGNHCFDFSSRALWQSSILVFNCNRETISSID